LIGCELHGTDPGNLTIVARATKNVGPTPFRARHFQLFGMNNGWTDWDDVWNTMLFKLSVGCSGQQKEPNLFLAFFVNHFLIYLSF
jgi:hypothetical protein